MAYNFGHANICLAGEEKYVARNIVISTFVTANPSLSSNLNHRRIQKL